MSVRPRRDLVTALVKGELPLEPIRRELAIYPWDADEPLVTLRTVDVASILGRFSQGKLAASDVEAWAKAIEMRDDVGFEERDRPRLSRVIFTLANPEVDGELTLERARALLFEIGAGTA